MTRTDEKVGNPQKSKRPDYTPAGGARSVQNALRNPHNLIVLRVLLRGLGRGAALLPDHPVAGEVGTSTAMRAASKAVDEGAASPQGVLPVAGSPREKN